MKSLFYIVLSQIIKISIVILLSIFSISLFAQKDCNDFPYNYIPVDLNDAICYLDCIWNEFDKLDFKRIPEIIAVNEYYRGYMTRISNNWGLRERNTDIYNYFQNLGVFHPDDMSHMILTSFHRYLNSKDLEIEKRAEQYNYLRKHSEIKKNKLRNTHFSNFEINDTVYFKYKMGFTSYKQKNYFYNNICDAKAILLEKNPSNLQIKVQLLESCDSLGVIVNIDDVYEKKDLKIVLIEKDKKFYLKKGEVQWTYFDLWQKNN